MLVGKIRLCPGTMSVSWRLWELSILLFENLQAMLKNILETNSISDQSLRYTIFANQQTTSGSA